MLSSAAQHAIHLGFGEKWRTECLNTMFHLPTLLCEVYSMNLKKVSDLSIEDALPNVYLIY